MARLRRVIAPGLPHHVTQRGNQKANVYRDEQDRKVYSRLLQERSNHYSIDILSYCLMTNHIHLVVVPHRKDSLSRGLRDAHGFYAVYFNRKYNLTGHFWQGRFYSCVLDEVGLWCARSATSSAIPSEPAWLQERSCIAGAVLPLTVV